MKPKSDCVKVYGVSSFVVTAPSVPKGASLMLLTVIATVSVSVALPVSVLTHLQRIGAVVIQIALIDQAWPTWR